MNEKVLREKILNKGMSLVFVSGKLDITREGLYNKLSGNSEFKASEIKTLADLLSLTPKEIETIFFA